MPDPVTLENYHTFPHDWTALQTFSQDIFVGLARLGRDGNNLRFGQGAVNPAAAGD